MICRCFPVLLLLLCGVLPARAHQVDIFAYRAAGKIVGEGYFADGTPCKQTPISFYNTAGELLKSDLTDEKGQFAVTLNFKKRVRVVLTASMGHKNQYWLESVASTEPVAAVNSPGILAPEAEDKAQLHAIIDARVKLALAPYQAFAKKYESGRIFRVAGGIGYIIGIFGLLVLVKLRDKL